MVWTRWIRSNSPTRWVAVAVAASWALVPGAGARAQQLPHAVVSLPAGTASVDIPFENLRRWMVVPVRIEGSRTLAFILDSGAPVTVLSRIGVARALPLTIVAEAELGGAGEGTQARVPIAGNVSMSIGPIQVTGAWLAVGLERQAIAGADGVIGAPLFDNLVVEIDRPHLVVRLYDPEQFEYRGPGVQLPLERLPSGHLQIRAQVSLAGEVPRLLPLLVDTGAGHALSIESSALPPDPNAPRLHDVVLGWGSNGVVRGDIVRVAQLDLGGLTLHDVITAVPDGEPWSQIAGAGPHVPLGNLGNQVLERFHVIFDVPHGRMWLEPRQDYDAPFGFDRAGVALVPWLPGAPAVEIADVVAGSPAAQAGLEIGDRITAIQDRPIAELSVAQVQDMMQGEPGTHLALTVQRGDLELRRVLTLRVLI